MQVKRWKRGFGALLSCLLVTACTLLIDKNASKKQCETHQECWARGLDGAVCVRELCQPAAADGVKATSEREPSTKPVDSSEGSSAQTAASTSDLSQSAPATLPSMAAAARVPVMMTSPAAAGGAAALPAGGAAGAAGVAASCPASGCPECATQADCERRGMKGAQCVDAVCWAADKAECSSDQECLSMGPEYEGGRCLNTACRPNPRWRCEAAQVSLSSEQRELTILVRDSLSLSALSMVHIVACAKLDLMCTNPVADGTTDRDGKLKISVPANFAGYLQTERREYAPAMYFLPNVFPEDGELEPFPLLSAGAIIDALATSLGASTDPDRGHLMLIAEDCMGTALAGATFMSPQADNKTVQFYVRDLLPSTAAKETAEIGNGGYLNFPSGTAVIQVDRTRGTLHLTTVTVVVRPGFISIAYMRPQLRAPEVP